jgi:RNA polymerase sigma factor (sigma-70 family)
MSNKTLIDNPEQLLKASLSGDRKSQELLYRLHYGFAMSICMRYAKSKEEALEVVNDGFMKVFTKGESFNPKYAFKAWLRRIMINAAVDYYRSQQKHYYHEDISEAIDISSNDSSAISQMNHQELIGLVQKLSPSYRMTFNLYVIEGYSHEEIGEKMGISIGTSKSNLARARENLRQMLKKSEVESNAQLTINN